MIFQKIRANVVPGAILPGTSYSAKGIYRRRGEAALVYRIPNRKAAKGCYEKGIAESEWEHAHARLTSSGEFSRRWFKENLGGAALEGSCNFIAIGAAFVLLGMAYYRRGKYTIRATSVPKRPLHLSTN